MTTKDKVKQRIDSIGDEYMDELDRLIEDFVRAKSENGKKSVMARLREIRIQAPEDFAANHDLYLSGEKRE
jgi:hypothetical protein